jgi:hypothetical protein
VILDVTIEGNVIADCPHAGVFAANVGGNSGIRVVGNTFADCGSPGNSCEWSIKHGVVVDRCATGTVGPNSFLNTAPFSQTNSQGVVFIP